MNFRVYLPKQRFIRTFVSRQYFPAQRKGGGISKMGTLVHLFGSVRSTQFIKPGAHYQESKIPEVRIKSAAKSSL